MTELKVLEVILQRVEAKLDTLDKHMSDRHQDHELRIRALESAKDRITMLAIVAGFVMPLIVSFIAKRVW